MKLKCTTLEDIKVALQTNENLDDCLYWRVVLYARRRNEKQLGIDYFETQEANFLSLIQLLVGAGADPFYTHEQFHFSSALDIACFNNYYLCKTILNSKHLTSEMREIVAEKINTLTSMIGQSLLLDPIPRYDMKFLNDQIRKNISYCLADVNKISDKLPKNYVNPNEKMLSLLQHALNSWENVANIKFNQVHYLDKACKIHIGHRLYSSSDTDGGNQQMKLLEGYTSFVTILGPRSNYTTSENYALMGAIHEIGHALGLHHPRNILRMKSNNEDYLPLLESNRDYTIMSYFPSVRGYFFDSEYAYPQTPMAYDIKIIQWLYGRNTEYNKESTTYSFNGTSFHLITLYDTGGIDTIDATSCIRNVVINLNQGVSYIGNTRVFIAENVDIENARTGNGTDLIIGNNLKNNFKSGEGDDIIITGPGFTSMNTGPGKDYIWINPEATEITIKECSQKTIDITEVLKDNCCSFYKNQNQITINNHCLKNRTINIKCGTGLEDANLVANRSYYIFELTNDYFFIELCAGIILGSVNLILSYLHDEVLQSLNRRLNQFEKNNPNSPGIIIIKDTSHMIFRSYMTYRMAITHDMTYYTIKNLTDYLDLVEFQKKPFTKKECFKAIGHALMGFISVGSIYLVTPFFSFFINVVKQLFSPQPVPAQSESRYKRWVKQTFFSLDQALEKSMYFIPGGKVIMDALEQQEKAVHQYCK